MWPDNTFHLNNNCLSRSPHRRAFLDQLLDCIDPFQPRFITRLYQLVSATSLIPTNVSYLGDDQEVCIAALLIRNNTLGGDERIGKHAKCRTRPIEKFYAVEIHVHRDNNIGAEIARLA